KSLFGPAQRAEKIPGAPSSASTARPESSAKAGSWAAAAAATALILALAWKVSPVSSGSPRPSSAAEIASMPCGANSSRISASLPGLWVAITSLPSIRRCILPSFCWSMISSENRFPPIGSGPEGMLFRIMLLGDRHLLQVHQPRHALARQRHQRQELGFRERCLLRGALYLDNAAVAGHDKIGVGIGLRILGVVEVEHRRAVIDAAGDRGDIVAQHVALDHAAGFHPGDAVGERDPGAGDRGGAGAAIGLQHVAVDRDLALAEGFEVDASAQRAADQALDFDGAAALLAGGRLAPGALQRCPRQHAVFGGDPAAALALEPWWQTFFQRGRDQHMGIAELDHAGTFGIFDHAAFQRHGAQFIRRTAAWPHGNPPKFRKNNGSRCL